MTVRILDAGFDPWMLLSDYQRSGAPLEGAYGATAVFVGTMRDFNEDQNVQSLFLEHYPGMTETCLEQMSVAATERWNLLDSLIVHRVGELHPGEPIVLVAVWSAHRKAAFEASRFLMEELKSKAPLWKKEQREDGARWVEHNTPG
ncbi:MAG: molybdenum cofactor biosynthesis protein MoaE [Thiogranum sp.]|nr:molybdenum cofactor biosynthesis protein MoaE [Thiogranum sp.]